MFAAQSFVRQRACIGAALALCACDAAAPNLDPQGVWTGVAHVFSATDTIEIAVERSGAALSGFGILHMAHELMPMHTEIHGVVSGGQVLLRIPGLSDSTTTFVLEDGTHMVKVRLAGDSEDVVLTRRDAGPLREGTYIIASTSGSGVAADYDTIVVYGDGRGRRHRAQGDYAFAVQTMWSTDGGVVVIEPSAMIPDFLRDTLHVDGAGLIRHTRSLYADSVTERYLRIGPAR